MSSDEEALRAIAGLDGQVFEGKRIGGLGRPRASALLLSFGISPEEPPRARHACADPLAGGGGWLFLSPNWTPVLPN
jgi:hypothetical protein